MKKISKDDIGFIENASLETVLMGNGTLLLSVSSTGYISLNPEDAEASYYLVCISVKHDENDKCYLYYASYDEVIEAEDGCFVITNEARSKIIDLIYETDPARKIWDIEDRKVINMGPENTPYIQVTPIYSGSDLYVNAGLFLYELDASSDA